MCVGRNGVVCDCLQGGDLAVDVRGRERVGRRPDDIVECHVDSSPPPGGAVATCWRTEIGVSR